MKVNASRKEVRKFGLLFAALGVAVSAYMLYKGKPTWVWFAGGAGVFLLAGLFAYALLRPVYVGWMRFAAVLAWINMRVLLGLFFFLILTPAGLLLRLLRKDPLEQEFDRSATTYWKKVEPVPFDRTRYERLF